MMSVVVHPPVYKGSSRSPTPLYRQVKLFERIGVTISISTMASWMIQVAEKCGPIIDLLRMEILSDPCINIDETTLQVLKEQDRADETKSYMWVFRGGPPENPSVIFQYSRTRSGSVAKDFVEGYKGYCQTDGYAGYDCLEKDSEIKLLGCFSHARRKFIDIIDARGKKDKGKAGSAEQALGYIQKLYRIERSAADRKLSPYPKFAKVVIIASEGLISRPQKLIGSTHKKPWCLILLNFPKIIGEVGL